MTAMLIGSAANLIFDSTPAADLRAYREPVEARLGQRRARRFWSQSVGGSGNLVQPDPARRDGSEHFGGVLSHGSRARVHIVTARQIWVKPRPHRGEHTDRNRFHICPLENHQPASR